LTSGQVDHDVYAIGDAAMIEDVRLPATAQGASSDHYMAPLIWLTVAACYAPVANQKAKYLTKKLNKTIKGKEHTDPFTFHNAGTLAYLGEWQAIYDRTKAENMKTKEAGRLAWLLWRSAYFTRTLSIRNK
jgi:NADH dehydrogenase FAD-containing subunit